MAAFLVVSVNPACGSIVHSPPPSVYSFTFTDPILPASISAADFQVGGVPANSFNYPGLTTITFSFTFPPLGFPQNYAMIMSGGSVLRNSDSLALTAFSCTFTYDVKFKPNFILVPTMDGLGNQALVPNEAILVRNRFVPEPFFGDIRNPTLWGNVHFGPGYLGKYYLSEWYIEAVEWPVVFTLADGELPPGIILSTIGATALGRLDGYPTELGSFTFTLMADGPNVYSGHEFTMVVDSAGGGDSGFIYGN
jgi:hypothetical protein